MDFITIAFNLAALLASIAALAISSSLMFKQTRLMRHSNQLPVLIEFLSELRSAEFNQQEFYLWDNLPDSCSETFGLSQLPEPTRSYAFNVCIYYQSLAYLVAFEIVDRRLAALPFHYRIAKTWNAVEPYVRRERILRGGAFAFLNFFEALAAELQAEDFEVMYRDVVKEAFPGYSRVLPSSDSQS